MKVDFSASVAVAPCRDRRVVVLVEQLRDRRALRISRGDAHDVRDEVGDRGVLLLAVVAAVGLVDGQAGRVRAERLGRAPVERGRRWKRGSLGAAQVAIQGDVVGHGGRRGLVGDAAAEAGRQLQAIGQRGAEVILARDADRLADVAPGLRLLLPGDQRRGEELEHQLVKVEARVGERLRDAQELRIVLGARAGVGVVAELLRPGASRRADGSPARSRSRRTR